MAVAMADLADRVAVSDMQRAAWQQGGTSTSSDRVQDSNKVDSSVLQHPRDDDASTVAVLQAALVELATANTELEIKVSALSATRAASLAGSAVVALGGKEAEVGIDAECEALCDQVLATARPQDIDAAAVYLAGLLDDARTEGEGIHAATAAAPEVPEVPDEATPTTTPVKRRSKLERETPPKAEKEGIAGREQMTIPKNRRDLFN